jgi:uncharacterized RDD family membrane protein YckC
VAADAESLAAPRYGEFWERLVAFLLVDTPISCLLYYPVAWGLGYGLWYGMLWMSVPDHSMERIQDAFYCGVGVVVDWLYFAVLESSAAQATVGKRLFRLAVVDKRGERISFMRATGRHFGKLLSAIPLGLGFVRIMRSPTKQAPHDDLASTYVVKRPRSATSAAEGASLV